VADRVINVITPADAYDLMTLAELKSMLGITTSDPTLDAQLQQWITQYSDVIATICNRVFAYEELTEIWRCTEYDQTNGMKRLFLSHYPLDKSYDIVLESPSGSALDSSSYAIEWKSGKIELLGTNSEPISVTYAGGYDVPEETPPALKQALGMMIREERIASIRAGTAGIRSMSHKESRVVFFDPNALAIAGAKSSGGFGGATAANALLMHYVRLEV
jgi:hypothetical protein